MEKTQNPIIMVWALVAVLAVSYTPWWFGYVVLGSLAMQGIRNLGRRDWR
jgi:hypothetical protein